ncbi:MAG: 5-(carboxyamino)imidazole ribonucleotide synthase [Candidatus Protistobacter heckmanni]|nr:5-(carboxyamino)imidazole ribonucleotide synthase [Candidatus Protistobacter heckmanni]
MSQQPKTPKKAALPILPGEWLGILGGGQLGRMFAHDAQAMGYRVCILDPDDSAPAGMAADRQFNADYDDEVALQQIATLCRAVSTEFENVPARSLDMLASSGCHVAPSSAAVSVAQNRVAEKKFLASCMDETGIAPAPHWVIEHADDIANIPARLLPGVLKTARMGYDGKGQVRVDSKEDVSAAWEGLKKVPCVLEQRLALAYEISALVARGCDGGMASYPLARNIHRNGILHLTEAPAQGVEEELARKIEEATRIVAARLDYVGVLCVEYFVLEDGSVVANELAPRPHNSSHYTMDACATSQFGQQLRAMAGLPLGSTAMRGHALMLNLMGDLWFPDGAQTFPEGRREPPWEALLTIPGACLHLYGKSEPRPGRKMGHVNFVAATPEAVRAACGEALALFGLS